MKEVEEDQNEEFDENKPPNLNGADGGRESGGENYEKRKNRNKKDKEIIKR